MINVVASASLLAIENKLSDTVYYEIDGFHYSNYARQIDPLEYSFCQQVVVRVHLRACN